MKRTLLVRLFCALSIISTVGFGMASRERNNVELEGLRDFGSVNVGQSRIQVMEVENNWSYPIEELVLSGDAPFSVLESNCGTKLRARRSCRAKVQFAPTEGKVYLRNGTFKITLNYKLRGTAKVESVAVGGTGNAAPACTLTASTSFAKVNDPVVVSIQLKSGAATSFSIDGTNVTSTKILRVIKTGAGHYSSKGSVTGLAGTGTCSVRYEYTLPTTASFDYSSFSPVAQNYTRLLKATKTAHNYSTPPPESRVNFSDEATFAYTFDTAGRVSQFSIPETTLSYYGEGEHFSRAAYQNTYTYTWNSANSPTKVAYAFGVTYSGSSYQPVTYTSNASLDLAYDTQNRVVRIMLTRGNPGGNPSAPAGLAFSYLNGGNLITQQSLTSAGVGMGDALQVDLVNHTISQKSKCPRLTEAPASCHSAATSDYTLVVQYAFLDFVQPNPVANQLFSIDVPSDYGYGGYSYQPPSYPGSNGNANGPSNISAYAGENLWRGAVGHGGKYQTGIVALGAIGAAKEFGPNGYYKESNSGARCAALDPKTLECSYGGQSTYSYKESFKISVDTFNGMKAIRKVLLSTSSASSTNTYDVNAHLMPNPPSAKGLTVLYDANEVDPMELKFFDKNSGNLNGDKVYTYR